MPKRCSSTFSKLPSLVFRDPGKAPKAFRARPWWEPLLVGAASGRNSLVAHPWELATRRGCRFADGFFAFCFAPPRPPHLEARNANKRGVAQLLYCWGIPWIGGGSEGIARTCDPTRLLPSCLPWGGQPFTVFCGALAAPRRQRALVEARKRAGRSSAGWRGPAPVVRLTRREPFRSGSTSM